MANYQIDGSKVRYLREKILMLSVNDTAEKMGKFLGKSVSKTTVIRIENEDNKHKCHPATLRALAYALDVESYTLLRDPTESQSNHDIPVSYQDDNNNNTLSVHEPSIFYSFPDSKSIALHHRKVLKLAKLLDNMLDRMSPEDKEILMLHSRWTFVLKYIDDPETISEAELSIADNDIHAPFEITCPCLLDCRNIRMRLRGRLFSDLFTLLGRPSTDIQKWEFGDVVHISPTELHILTMIFSTSPVDLLYLGATGLAALKEGGVWLDYDKIGTLCSERGLSLWDLQSSFEAIADWNDANDWMLNEILPEPIKQRRCSIEDLYRLSKILDVPGETLIRTEPQETRWQRERMERIGYMAKAFSEAMGDSTPIAGQNPQDSGEKEQKKPLP